MPVDNLKIRRAAVYEHFLRWHITDDQGKRPPYVIVKSIQLEATNFGDVFVTCDVVQTDGSIAAGLGEHYPAVKVANLVDPERLTRLEEKVGLSPGYCLEYNLFLEIDPDDEAQLHELRTQRCDDCYEVIRVWDDIQWRMKVHKIRCDKCAKEIMRRGYNAYDAYYVE